MQRSTEEQGRPLFGVNGEVCSKKYLTGPTLLEMSGLPTNRGVDSLLERRDINTTCRFIRQMPLLPAKLAPPESLRSRDTFFGIRRSRGDRFSQLARNLKNNSWLLLGNGSRCVQRSRFSWVPGIGTPVIRKVTQSSDGVLWHGIVAHTLVAGRLPICLFVGLSQGSSALIVGLPTVTGLPTNQELTHLHVRYEDAPGLVET